MCVTTVVLETGILPISEPETHLMLEAPGGLVAVTAQCMNGRVDTVTVTNVPSFVDKLDTDLEVEGIGSLKVDTAYGGDSFVVVKASDLGFTLAQDEARDIAQTGIKITNAANQQLGFNHPKNQDWDHISFCQIVAPVEEVKGIKTGKNAVAIQPGKIDRSPCGTGCSARLAILNARGEIAVGEPFVGRSIIESRFECRIEAKTRVGKIEGVVPSLRGRAWITGTHQHLLDPDDPWPAGYRLSDTWPVIQ